MYQRLTAGEIIIKVIYFVMKKLIILFLFFTPFSMIGQEEDTLKKQVSMPVENSLLPIADSLVKLAPQKQKIRKIDVGFSYSPDYCYRLISTSSTDRWMANLYDTTETYKVGYSTGINGVYHFSENATLSSGLLFSDKGEQVKSYAVPTITKYVNHYYYLDIPLKINYYISQKKARFYLTAGVSANVFLNHRIVYFSDNSTDKNAITGSKNLSKVNFSGIAGVGIDCPLAEKWYFKLEINYRQNISPILNAPVKRYLFNVGPQIGFYYQF